MGTKILKDCFDLAIVVDDAEASLKFWGDTLGFELEQVIEGLPGGAKQYRMRHGQSLVKLITKGLPGPLGEAGYRVVTVPVADFDAMVDECRNNGSLVMEPQPSGVDPETGKKVCVIRDPEGNLVELESILTSASAS